MSKKPSQVYRPKLGQYGQADGHWQEQQQQQQQVEQQNERSVS
jgi:hypothetical protein